MTRTRLASPSLPLFLLAAAVVAALAFGVTRLLADDASGALPPLAVAGDSAAAAPGAMNLAKLTEQRMGTTVTIAATIDNAPMSGAGVVVDAKNGTIVTASHVVRDYEKAMVATRVIVHFKRGDEVQAEIKAIDQFNDLAILQIDPAQLGFELAAAPLAKNSDTLMVGSEVAAIGAPFGLDFTVTSGHVNAAHRVQDSRINVAYQIPDMIQFDAAINKGNSGGPLFNARGEVVGIVQQISTPTDASAGVAFAVSSNLVLDALASYRATGQILHADLGIDARTVTPQLGADANLGTKSGAVIQKAWGPAATAGLATGPNVSHMGTTVAAGDVIVELAGRPVTSRDDLARISGLLDPNQSVQISYLRGGQRHETSITPAIREIV